MKKIILNLDFDGLKELLISHNWFTKGTYYDYDNFVLFIQHINNNEILDSAYLHIIASRIKKFSDTEESVDEIRQALETIITVSEREVR